MMNKWGQLNGVQLNVVKPLGMRPVQLRFAASLLRLRPTSSLPMPLGRRTAVAHLVFAGSILAAAPQPSTFLRRTTCWITSSLLVESPAMPMTKTPSISAATWARRHTTTSDYATEWGFDVVMLL